MPNEGCVIFLGDTIDAGTHDKGQLIRRLHVYLGKGAATHVDKVVDNTVLLQSKPAPDLYRE